MTDLFIEFYNQSSPPLPLNLIKSVKAYLNPLLEHPDPKKFFKLVKSARQSSKPEVAFALLRLGAKGIDPAKATLKKGNRDRALDIFGKAALGA